MSEQISILSEIEELLGDDLGALRAQKTKEAEEARQARIDELLASLPEVQAKYDEAVERVVKAREARSHHEKELSAAETEYSKARYVQGTTSRRLDVVRRELHDLQLVQK